LQFESESRRVAALICRRVDGIPLAIELAASRSDVFDVSTILKRLEERFKLLTSRSRTMHPHHRTLRALFDWSYELLDADESRAFRRLAVFAGGARFDDAEHILSFAGMAPDLVPELLARLHDKSLVEIDRAEPPRFSMLQTIHDYARERLTDAYEMVELETSFATHYLELAVTSGPELRSGSQAEAIARLSADIDNVRAALALSSGNPALRELGLRALLPLALYWMRTGALTEGLSQIRSLISDTDEPSIGVASAYVGAAFLEFNRRGYGEGSVYAARACEAATACRDEWLIIYSSNALNQGLSALGEHREAAAAAALERAKHFGDPWLQASAAWEAGWEAKQRGDQRTSSGHFSEALEHARATGDQFMVMTCSKLLGETVIATDPARAARLTAEAIGCLVPGQLSAQAACVESLVEIALALERTDDAARLFAIAGALRRHAGGRLKRELIERVGERDDASLADANDIIRRFLDAVT
jgi:predicted ATPase